jgi:hypothetical protein
MYCLEVRLLTFTRVIPCVLTSHAALRRIVAFLLLRGLDTPQRTRARLLDHRITNYQLLIMELKNEPIFQILLQPAC